MRIVWANSAPAAVGAYSTASPIVVTYTDWQGNEQTGTIALTSANGGETVTGLFDAAAVVSVAIPAQTTTNGWISVGLMAREGRGSHLLIRAGLLSLALDEWQPTTVRIDVLDDESSIREFLSRILERAVVEVGHADGEARHVVHEEVGEVLGRHQPGFGGGGRGRRDTEVQRVAAEGDHPPP